MPLRSMKGGDVIKTRKTTLEERAAYRRSRYRPDGLTSDRFLERARRIHGDKYEYPEPYKTAKTPMRIICPMHGEFRQAPDNHASSTRPQGCPECSAIRRGVNSRKTHEQFVSEARAIHGDKYSYPDTYKTAKTNMRIICQIHGEYWQQPTNHLNAKKPNGCPSCAGYGFNLFAKAILYVVELDDEWTKQSLIKVGVTNKTTQQRFEKLPDGVHLTVLREYHFETGTDARALEKLVHKKFLVDKRGGAFHLGRVNGGTECFCPETTDEIIQFIDLAIKEAA